MVLAASALPFLWSQGRLAGRIVPDVKCAAQYQPELRALSAIELLPDRAWPVSFAFDPAARGTAPLERYQASAKKYAYIIARSNNSRNGLCDVSTRTARAMILDAGERSRIDKRRVYTAGLSGGDQWQWALPWEAGPSPV